MVTTFGRTLAQWETSIGTADHKGGFVMHIKRYSLLAALVGALLLPSGLAFADTTFNWTFTGPHISGSGTLTAIASGTAGLDYITGGSGNVDYDGTTLAVTFGVCLVPGARCTFVNTDGVGANLEIDNWLYPGNPAGSQLTGYGVAVTPTPIATPHPYLGIWDTPSQSFYGWGGNQYENLSTPFTVSSVPDGGATLMLLGAALFGIETLRRKFHV
jgi:hypothetical protein